MSLADLQEVIKMSVAVVGVSGGLVGLLKYFSGKREKELREWQKVVLYKIFCQDESNPLNFSTILEKYRIEAQAFIDIDLKKKEMSEDTLRRVLLELVSSNVLTFEPGGSFQLKVSVPKVDPYDKLESINKELVKLVGSNPFVYTIDEVAKEIAPKVDMDIPILKNAIRQGIDSGNLEIDDNKRIAFTR